MSLRIVDERKKHCLERSYASSEVKENISDIYPSILLSKGV